MGSGLQHAALAHSPRAAAAAGSLLHSSLPTRCRTPRMQRVALGLAVLPGRVDGTCLGTETAVSSSRVDWREPALGAALEPYRLSLRFSDPAVCWEQCRGGRLALRVAPVARQRQACAAPYSAPSPWAQCGREAIFLNTSWAGLGSARHATKKHIHPNPLLSPLRELGFVFKSVWQATKLAESGSWLATRSKNVVLSPPLFPPPHPPDFFSPSLSDSFMY